MDQEIKKDWFLPASILASAVIITIVIAYDAGRLDQNRNQVTNLADIVVKDDPLKKTGGIVGSLNFLELKEVADNYQGIINCDGWETYQTYQDDNDKVLLQRCWAHPIREIEALVEKYDEVKPLFKWFQKIFIKVCKARESGKPKYQSQKKDAQAENLQKMSISRLETIKFINFMNRLYKKYLDYVNN